MQFRTRNAAKVAALGAAASLNSAQAQNAPDDAIRNADGSRTILRSQQLPEANERRGRWCKMHGGMDVTNDGDVTLGPNTFDAVVCLHVDPSTPGFAGAYIPKNSKQTVISPDAEIEQAPFIVPGRQ
jgi:hypothetical protein